MAVVTKYYCRDCWREIREDEKPCSACGSIKRLIKAEIEETITVGETIVMRQKRKGFKKFMVEQITGWFPSKDKKYSKGVHQNRIIDKEKNNYFHEVKDIATGEIIHKENEKLSEHK